MNKKQKKNLFHKEFQNRINIGSPNNLLIKKKLEKLLKSKFKKNFNKYKKFLLVFKNDKKKLNHPIRVTYYITLFKKNLNFENILLGLYHNFYELKSNNNIKSIDTKIDYKLKNKIICLTVDRTKRWNKNYLENYYNKIKLSTPDVKMIKCIDKLDNLFNLYKNRNKKVKKNYLWEIKKYIFPISLKISKEIHFYIKQLYLYNIKLLNEKKN